MVDTDIIQRIVLEEPWKGWKIPGIPVLWNIVRIIGISILLLFYKGSNLELTLTMVNVLKSILKIWPPASLKWFLVNVVMITIDFMIFSRHLYHLLK